MEHVLWGLESAVSFEQNVTTSSIISCPGVIYTSTCSSTISTNTTYIRNPNYPSSYTPSTTGTCTFTINKVSSDVCQLRLDFETFSGFVTTTPAGSCSDSFAASGQTGKDPPTICGTNTGYHSKYSLTSHNFDYCTHTSLLLSSDSAKLCRKQKIYQIYPSKYFGNGQFLLCKIYTVLELMLLEATHAIWNQKPLDCDYLNFMNITYTIILK